MTLFLIILKDTSKRKMAGFDSENLRFGSIMFFKRVSLYTTSGLSQRRDEK